MSLDRLVTAALTAVIAATVAASAAADRTAQSTGGAGAAEFAGSELETFVDDLVRTQLQEYDVPGAVLTIVSGGEVALSKGYGHADAGAAGAGRPGADPVRHRLGDEALTATAVMQLVERGELDLDADVNSYLSHFAVPNTLRADHDRAPAHP